MGIFINREDSPESYGGNDACPESIARVIGGIVGLIVFISITIVVMKFSHDIGVIAESLQKISQMSELSLEQYE